MNKPCKVIRLKTQFTSDKVQRLVLEQSYDTGVGPVTEILTTPIQVNTPSTIEWFHLYVLSDDDMNTFDWVYYPDKNNVIRVPAKCTVNNAGGMRKIIATTDERLHVNEVPQLSEAFVKAYADNNGIDEILVEYAAPCDANKKYITAWRSDDVDCSYCGRKGMEFGDCQSKDNIPKLRDDNTIIVHQAKTYTRAEVETLLFNLADHWGYTSGKSDIDDFNKWCDENL